MGAHLLGGTETADEAAARERKEWEEANVKAGLTRDGRKKWARGKGGAQKCGRKLKHQRYVPGNKERRKEINADPQLAVNMAAIVAGVEELVCGAAKDREKIQGWMPVIIYDVRRQRDMSQRDLAETLGLSAPYICDVEWGRRTLNKEPLAKVLQWWVEGKKKQLTTDKP